MSDNLFPYKIKVMSQAYPKNTRYWGGQPSQYRMWLKETKEILKKEFGIPWRSATKHDQKNNIFYPVFYFTNQEDATIFKLRFG